MSNKLISLPSSHSTSIVFWKPYGVLCQFTPGIHEHQSTLKDWIDFPSVYPAGRLDRESEGLLILTSNGSFQDLVCHPRFQHKKTYWVQVERTPSVTALKQLQDGVMIRSGLTLPAEVRLLDTDPQLPPRIPPIRERKNIETAWLEIRLSEGKNRQIRRMTAAVGYPTLRLVRVGLELGDHSLSFSLDTLQPGQWRVFTPEEETQSRLLLKKSSSPSQHVRKHKKAKPKVGSQSYSRSQFKRRSRSTSS